MMVKIKKRGEEMIALTLNFKDDEIEIINKYMKANKINLADLPSIFTSFLITEKYNNETIRAMEEAERIVKDPNIKSYSNTKDLFKDLEI